MPEGDQQLCSLNVLTPKVEYIHKRLIGLWKQYILPMHLTLPPSLANFYYYIFAKECAEISPNS